MSLSSGRGDGSGHRGGRVIIGMHGNGLSEDALNKLRGADSPHHWSPKTEEEYMRRVQEKARAKAQEILAEAMQEAEAIRARAAEEGMAVAAQSAQTQLDDALGQISATLAGAMDSIQQGRDEIWQRHRDDIVALVRLAVQRLLAVELDERREEVMASLLEQALGAIDTHRNLVFRIRPEDEEIMQALLEQAKTSHPSLERWGLKVDASLEAGGMVLESEEGMVDNSLGGRMSAVEPIFDQLGIAGGESE